MVQDMFDGQTKLGDIAAHGPSARGVLMRFRLDFCCGGTTSLARACSERGVQVHEVTTALETATATSDPATDWSKQPLQAVVEHVLSRYHEPLPTMFGGLIASADKVERVHEGRGDCPRGLASHLRSMWGELQGHMGKEERVLFPLIVAGRVGPQLSGPVAAMSQEHEEHGENLRELRRLTADLTPPDDACATWTALYEQLHELESELMAHIHLENSILFPRALQGS